jgi:Spy/CpxP family protein refolding chaperone
MFARILKAAAGTLLVISFVSLAQAEPPKISAKDSAAKDPVKELRWTKIADELKLTSDQRTKLDKIRSEFRKTLPGKRKAMESSEEDLQKALRSSATEDELRKKFGELAKKQDEFATARFEKILAIRALLTSEQREKFKGLDGPHPQGSESDRRGER